MHAPAKTFATLSGLAALSSFALFALASVPARAQSNAPPPSHATASAPLPPLPAAPPDATAATAPDSTAPPVLPPPPSPPPPVAAPAPATAADSAPALAVASNGCPEGTRVHCHDGFYLRMALGFGATSLSGDGPESSVSIKGGSLPFRLAIGGTVTRGVVLGAVLYGAGTTFGNSTSGTGSVGSVRGEFGALGFLVDWYPAPSDGWHVGADLGFGFVGIDTADAAVGGDLAASLHGGYDGWIADDWSFGAMLVASGGSRTILRDDNDNDSGFRLGAASIGVLASFLYH